MIVRFARSANCRSITNRGRTILLLPRVTIRALSITSYRPRDVLSRYRTPSRASSEIMNGAGAFETSSTTPAGVSFQDVPPPNSGENKGTKMAIPVPAMMGPLIGDKAVTEKDKSKKKPLDSEKEIIVEGVVIPAKPVPPGEEECCMSGCVHCVYTIYADDLELYTTAIESAKKALLKSNTPKTQWPKAVRDMDTEGGGGGKEGMKKREEEKLESGMDPSMAAFLALENKIKKKQINK